MHDKISISSSKLNKVLFWLLLMLGILVRIWKFGTVPGGLNQDEAYAGYEAFSLLFYGIDSWGYRFPVYFISWGSGMNVLNSYLMIPFIQGGINTWSIRLPQLLIACVSLVVFYKILKELFSEKEALLGLFFLAICPWHICMARWGLESNLAPGFLLFGQYFFLMGRKNTKYFCLSALSYGLSLYCYATVWIVVPAIIGLYVLYFSWCRELKLDRYTVLSVFILAVLAAPLILYLLVNWDVIPEIRTKFLSVPHMVVMRSDISTEHMIYKMTRFLGMLLLQRDGLLWNSVPYYGLYYYTSIPFLLLGLYDCVCQTIKSIQRRKFSMHSFLLLPLIPAGMLGFVINVNVNRVNCVHFPVIFLCVIGLAKTVQLIQMKKIRFAAALLLAAYCIQFAGFCHLYFNDYNKKLSRSFYDGYVDAIKFASALDGDRDIRFNLPVSLVLYAAQIPAQEFADSVTWQNYPSPFLTPDTFGRYHFTGDMDMNSPDILIVDAEWFSELPEPERNTAFFGNYVVVY